MSAFKHYTTSDIINLYFVMDDHVYLNTFIKNFEQWKISSSEPAITTNFVSKLMHDTKDGQTLLKYYEEHKNLHETQRSLLTNLICSNVKANVSKPQLKTIAEEITVVFPNEIAVLIFKYFIFYIYLIYICYIISENIF